MDLKRIFDLKGINWWIMLSGMGMNLGLTYFLSLGMSFAVANEMSGELTIVLVLLGGLGIPLLTAYVCGRLADERYLTYAFYSLIGYLILAVPGAVVGGLFGAFMVLFGILGAYNGGFLAARRSAKKREAVRKLMESPEEEK